LNVKTLILHHAHKQHDNQASGVDMIVERRGVDKKRKRLSSMGGKNSKSPTLSKLFT